MPHEQASLEFRAMGSAVLTCCYCYGGGNPTYDGGGSKHLGMIPTDGWHKGRVGYHGNKPAGDLRRHIYQCFEVFALAGEAMAQLKFTDIRFGGDGIDAEIQMTVKASCTVLGIVIPLVTESATYPIPNIVKLVRICKCCLAVWGAYSL